VGECRVDLGRLGRLFIGFLVQIPILPLKGCLLECALEMPEFHDDDHFDPIVVLTQ
jgi:hypothetical protein